MRFIRDREKGGGEGYGGRGRGRLYAYRVKRMGEGGMEVGKEGDYIPIAILSPPELLLH